MRPIRYTSIYVSYTNFYILFYPSFTICIIIHLLGNQSYALICTFGNYTIICTLMSNKVVVDYTKIYVRTSMHSLCMSMRDKDYHTYTEICKINVYTILCLPMPRLNACLPCTPTPLASSRKLICSYLFLYIVMHSLLYAHLCTYPPIRRYALLYNIQLILLYA